MNKTKSSKFIILSLYRVPTRDLNQLIKSLDDALKCLYKSKAELLICGDINTHCLTESTWGKKNLGASLLTLYNL